VDSRGFIVDAARPDPLWPALREAAGDLGKWWRIARLEVRRRFHQTGLGPWWMTIGNGLFVIAVAFLYAGVTGSEPARYLPYLLVGFLVWSFVSDALASGSNVFVSEYAFISQMRINYLGILFKDLFRRAMIFAPNLVLLAILPFLPLPWSWSLLTVPLAVLAILLNAWLQSYWCSVISAAFRDFPMVIAMALRFLFFMTPILWDARAVEDPLRQAVALLNPFHHIIETVRAPITDGAVSGLSWAVVGVITLANLVAFALAFRRAQARIVYLAG
jgi:ABC-type polysaccharide/polyol phosphate export permease